MRWVLFLSFFLMTLTGTCRTSITSDDSFITVSERCPRYFETSSGEAWIPVMMNYLIPDRDSSLVITEKYFSRFSANGGNALRIWISAGFLEIEDGIEGLYNPIKIERIKRVLKLAEKYNIRIKFTLQHIRTIDKNPPRSAGWANRRNLAQNYSNIDEYTATERGRTSYLNRAAALAEFFSNNTTIFGWELWNEMNAAAWKNEGWADFSVEMLPKIKRLFPNHLVTQTLGSLDRLSANETYKLLFGMSANEYISIHRYLDEANENYAAVKGDIDLLIADAMEFANVNVANRPIVINEVGSVKPNHAGPSSFYSVDTTGVFLHDMLFAPFFCGAAGCGAMWHWDSYIYQNNLWFHYARFVEMINDVDPIEECFKPFRYEQDGVRCYGLQGKTKSMIWCRNIANSWQTELRDGCKVSAKKSFVVKLDSLYKHSTISSVHYYDPWSGNWTKGENCDNTLRVPDFDRSIVIILNK